MNNEKLFFDPHINGFARVEYLSVFVALLYAFAVAEFFIGWSKMIRNREGIIFSTDHLVFSFIYFWILIINWYTLWVQIKYLDKGFVYFVATLVPIMITYVAAIYIFPDFDKVKDLKTYFDKNFNIIIFTTLAFMISTLGIQLWEEHIPITSPFVLLRCINGLILFIIALFNLKKLRRFGLLILGIGLFLGSFALAFV